MRWDRASFKVTPLVVVLLLLLVVLVVVLLLLLLLLPLRAILCATSLLNSLFKSDKTLVSRATLVNFPARALAISGGRGVLSTVLLLLFWLLLWEEEEEEEEEDRERETYAVILVPTA